MVQEKEHCAQKSVVALCNSLLQQSMELFAFDIFIMPWKCICVHAYTHVHRHAHVLVENPSKECFDPDPDWFKKIQINFQFHGIQTSGPGLQLLGQKDALGMRHSLLSWSLKCELKNQADQQILGGFQHFPKVKHYVWINPGGKNQQIVRIALVSP